MTTLPVGLARKRVEIETAEVAFHAAAQRLIGVRILDRLGWTNFLRVMVAALWLISLGQVITIFRSDLIHPAEIGSDSSNYLAASERLLDGHPVYALQPGDRPVPLDNAPDWTVPILSPPTVATSYAPETVLPGGMAAYPAWLIGLAGTVAVGLLAIALAPPLLVFLAIQVLPGLAVTAWSGNVNALLGPAIVIAWLGGRSNRPLVQIVAGVVVAIAVCVKIGPILLGWWLFVRRRWTAVAAMVIAGLAIAGFTVLKAGFGAFVDYADVVREASANPSPLSVQGALRTAGLEPAIAALGLIVFLVAIAVAVYVLRDRPESLLLAVAGTVFATSVVRYDSIGLLVVGGVAWVGRGLFLRPATTPAQSESDLHKPALLAASVASLVAVAAVCVSVFTGGLDRSSLSVENETDAPVVVRFVITAQDASFGFVVPPRTTIAGWKDIGGGSPPVLTVWSTACEFQGQVRLPRTGGTVIAAVGRLQVGDWREAEFADYVSACAEDLRAARIIP